jgi:hypothetical protein
MTTTQLREVIRLERIAKTFSESFVDTITAQIGANAHDPKLFVQTLMRKMMLQALHEATTPLVEENESLKKEAHLSDLATSDATDWFDALCHDLGEKLLIPAKSTPTLILEAVDQLRTKNERLKKEHDEDLTLICATQEGRTQWNAREVWKTNQKLNDELDQLRTSLSKSESQNVGLREAVKVIGAPQWLKDRKAALAKRPPPTVERVRAQWKASAEHAIMLGTFAPTTHWNDAEKVLYITLETKQMVAVLHHAPIPSDESKEAKWGRRILEEIHRMYLEHVKKHGACEIRLIPRRYDGEIV